MENKSHERQNDILARVKKQAKEVFDQNMDEQQPLPSSGDELKSLIQELQVLQVELEMQNDELLISHQVLEAERGKFISFYDLAPVGYFILNHFGIVEEVNQTALNLLELSRKGLIKKRLQKYIVHQDVPVFYSFLGQMSATFGRQSCMLKLSPVNGRIYHVQLEGICQLSKLSGDLQYYIAMIDVTERDATEQRLRETNERLEMTLNASSTGTWNIDMAAERVFLDQFSYTIYGLQNWQFDGSYEMFSKLIHPEDRERVHNNTSAAISNESELDIEYRILLPKNKVGHVAVRGHMVYKNDTDRHFAGIVMDITQRKKLEAEAEEMRSDQQRKMMAAALQAEENERKKISETLHDSVSQLLYAIRLKLENYYRGNGQKAEFGNVNELLDQAISETRNIAFALTPGILTDFGLYEALKEMCKRVAAPGFAVDFKLKGRQKRLDHDMEISIFRIAQELVNNCIKHAKATMAIVKLHFIDELIVMSVQDDGIGFDNANESVLLKGSGLRSIKNRVELYNGQLTMSADIGRGSIITVKLKYKE